MQLQHGIHLINYCMGKGFSATSAQNFSNIIVFCQFKNYKPYKFFLNFGIIKKGENVFL